MSTNSFALSNIAEVIRGVSFDKDESKDDPHKGYIPIIRAGNISDRLDLIEDLVWVPEYRASAEQRLRINDIVICMSSGSKAVVGKCAPLENDWFGSVGAFCAIIRPKPTCVLPAFLTYFLKSPTFRQWTSQSEGVNIKNIRKSELESYRLSLPSFDEQRRLVDILSRAEGIVRLRREAQKKAQELIPALFLDIFGDPATNPKGWPVVQIGELCGVQTGATPSRDNLAYYNGETPWVKTAEVIGGTIITQTEEHISELALSETNCKVFPIKTILVAMYGQGQTRGRSAILGIESATNQACAAILPSKKIMSDFLLCFLQTQYEHLRGLAPPDYPQIIREG